MHDSEKANTLIGEALTLFAKADALSLEDLPDETARRLIESASMSNCDVIGMSLNSTRADIRRDAYAKLRQARELLS